MKSLFTLALLPLLPLVLFTGCSTYNSNPGASLPPPEELTEPQSIVTSVANPESMEFWQVQRRGANGNLQTLRPEWFQAASEAGIQIIRFNGSWFQSEHPDFLIGDVNGFSGIPREDLDLLIRALDEAHKYDLKIVLTMFELPGRRCFNEVEKENHDYRLWHQREFHYQAQEFWIELASAVKDHPAIAAYNILNEPHPELAYGFEEANQEFLEWFEEVKGTTADINLFNRRMVAAIRSVDPSTPIVVEGYFYGSPIGMPYLEPIDDPAILYSFHDPSPWQFKVGRANNGKYEYPQAMPATDQWNSPAEPWTLEDLEACLDPVYQFIEENQIPSHQIYAGEFWCERTVSGCAEYFDDLMAIYKEEQWHWSFYAFREDMSWTGLDYEMGGTPVDWTYWTALENGEDYHDLQADMRHDNPIWTVLLRGLAGE